MKKALTLIAVAAMASFVACGPSAEEKAKMEERAKFVQDSIANSISESMSTEAPATTDSAAATTATPEAAPAHDEHGHDNHQH
jgi:hypothetical protein